MLCGTAVLGAVTGDCTTVSVGTAVLTAVGDVTGDCTTVSVGTAVLGGVGDVTGDCTTVSVGTAVLTAVGDVTGDCTSGPVDCGSSSLFSGESGSASFDCGDSVCTAVLFCTTARLGAVTQLSIRWISLLRTTSPNFNPTVL